MDIIHDKLSAFNYDAISAEGGEDMENKQLAFDLQDMSGETIIEEEQKETENTEFLQSLGTNARWIWEDPEILTADLKAAIEEMPPYDRPRFIVELIDKYFKKYPEFAEFEQVLIWQEPELLLELFRSLTLEELEENVLSENRKTKASAIFDRLQERLKEIDESYGTDEDTHYANKHARIDPEDITEVWPIITIRYNFTLSELRKLYYLKNPRRSPKLLAEEHGAITSIGERLAKPSRKEFAGWLDEIPNPTAYMAYVGPDFWSGVEVDEGYNFYYGEEARILRAAKEQGEKAKREVNAGAFGVDRPKEHERINRELMNLLNSLALEKGSSEIDVYLPSLSKVLNPNYRTNLDEYDAHGKLNEKGRRNQKEAEKRAQAAAREEGNIKYTKDRPSIMRQLAELDYWIGIINQEQPLRNVVIAGINEKEKTVKLYLPYITERIKAENEAALFEAEKKKLPYTKPREHFLIHSSIDAERNKLAIDLVYTIVDRLVWRGLTPTSDFKENTLEKGEQLKKVGGKVSYSAKYSYLIDKTYLLKNAYNKASDSKRGYDILNRTFTRAFHLLHTKTDIYDYFLNLNIPEIAPSKRTIDNVITITHDGKNPNYKHK